MVAKNEINLLFMGNIIRIYLGKVVTLFIVNFNEYRIK